MQVPCVPLVFDVETGTARQPPYRIRRSYGKWNSQLSNLMQATILVLMQLKFYARFELSKKKELSNEKEEIEKVEQREKRKTD